MKTINAWVRYITIFLFSILFLLISGCENTRHSIGISGKPLSTDMEQINYMLTSLKKDAGIEEDVKKENENSFGNNNMWYDGMSTTSFS